MFSNCSSHVRTTLASTAGQTTHFVVTPMAATPANASTELFSIVPLEMTKEDVAEKANYRFHDRYNSSFSAEVVYGDAKDNFSNDPSESDQQRPTIMQEINTSFNSTDDQEYLAAKYDKTYTLSNWTDTKTTEASSLVLRELNHSSAYLTINPTRPKPKESLPLIYGINQTSNNNTGKRDWILSLLFSKH